MHTFDPTTRGIGEGAGASRFLSLRPALYIQSQASQDLSERPFWKRMSIYSSFKSIKL